MDASTPVDLRTFLTPMTTEERDAFAAKCENSRGHLQNVMYGQRPCAPDLAVAIEQHSGGKVRRWSLRPADWWRIWPELIGLPGAPVVPGHQSEVPADRETVKGG